MDQTSAAFANTSPAKVGMGKTQQFDYNASIANQLTQQQLLAATTNPDLRKKLRVDRIRKMAMGEKSAMQSATFDDPGQADWIK